MKALLSTMILFSALPSFATESKVYCKNAPGVVLSVLAENGWECASALLVSHPDNACFVGLRSEVVQILNQLAARGVFEGTDGESIRNAKIKGRAEISYTVIDQANHTSSLATLKACTAEFFKN